MTIMFLQFHDYPGVYGNLSHQTLMGVAFRGSSCVDGCVRKKVTRLKRMGERIAHLQSHDALTLLCHSLAIPKMLPILRTAPCFHLLFLLSMIPV